MTVYIVIVDYGSCQSTRGVFSTREAANREVIQLMDYNSHASIYIEARKLDEPTL
jgi:hypothetical protein